MLLSVKSYTMLVFPVPIFHNKTRRECSVFAMYDLLNILQETLTRFYCIIMSSCLEISLPNHVELALFS